MQQHGVSGSVRARNLRVVGGPRRSTADQVLRDGARVFADYIKRRIGEVDEQDPSLPRLVATAEQLRSLAGR